MKNQAKSVFLFIILLFLAPFAFCQTAVSGVQRSTLPNGLELALVENHAVPLARIQITFRCGAITQTPETVGLFHLYEHMLFKGNRVFRNQSDFQAAMRQLGVSSWNGGTSVNNVTYYFTVPSDKLDKGIEFWADAVRYPLFNPDELVTEKDVVMNEVQGFLDDPDTIYQSGVNKALFWKYPWRKDAVGYEKIIRGATVKTLRDIQNTYYIPNNAALFVGGDVDPKAVRASVEKYFGDWKRGKNPWASPPAPQGPVPKTVLLVYPDEQMFSGIAYVSAGFRGPDLASDANATYGADVWGKLIDDPNGKFKQDIFSTVPGLYKKEYISAYYATERDGGFIGFSTYMVLAPTGDNFARAMSLEKAFMEEVSAMAANQAFFDAGDYEVMRRQLGDERIVEQETVDGYISSLSFWWAVAGLDYYLGYTDNLKRVGYPQLRSFLSSYLLGRNFVLSVRINPADFQRERIAAEKAGFTVITKADAYWWQAK
jgi:zinc protease